MAWLQPAWPENTAILSDHSAKIRFENPLEKNEAGPLALPHQKEALIVQRLVKHYTFKLILNPTDWIIELDAPRIKYQTC